MPKLPIKPVLLLFPILLLIAGVTIAIKNDDVEKYKIKTTNVFVEQELNLPNSINADDSKVGGNLFILDSGSQIDWFSVSSGQTEASSANYGMLGTTAQAVAGFSSSANYGVIQGFYVEPSPSANCCVIPGDANHDGVVNILDITYLIGYLYMGGPPPPCMYEGDANGDCTINILDITYLIAFLYQQGPAPFCAANCPDW